MEEYNSKWRRDAKMGSALRLGDKASLVLTAQGWRVTTDGEVYPVIAFTPRQAGPTKKAIGSEKVGTSALSSQDGTSTGQLKKTLKKPLSKSLRVLTGRVVGPRYASTGQALTYGDQGQEQAVRVPASCPMFGSQRMKSLRPWICSKSWI